MYYDSGNWHTVVLHLLINQRQQSTEWLLQLRLDKSVPCNFCSIMTNLWQSHLISLASAAKVKKTFYIDNYNI